MAAIPIWNDKIVEITGTSVQFRIYDSANSISLYQGVAHAKPGESSVKIRVNDICADYLVNALPTLTDRTFTSFALPSFVVQKYSGGSWSNVETIQFYNDWSYDYGFSGATLSDPINGKVTTDMFILFSGKGIGNISAAYHKTNGTITSRSTIVSPTPNDGTCVFDAGAVANTERIAITGINYFVVPGCHKYALYYVNAFGGWDQFLLEGNDMMTDEVTRHIREVEYSNTLLVNRGMDNYVNEVKKTLTLYSGFLTDDQASRMHHLLNSPLVYLCHIPSGDMIPVIMKTNTCEYKTFSNQGNKMVNYTMQVEIAQNRIRR